MSEVSYQTVRLSRGRHSSPDEGVCVMEMASMLAHEPFSDHPETVCPVIGEFLRTYNDSVGEDHRQDLYAYAADAVGTRADKAVERRRARMCLEAARGRIGLSTRLRACFKAHAGTYAALVLARRREDGHSRALALLDELIAVGGGRTALEPLDAVAAEGRTEVAGRR